MQKTCRRGVPIHDLLTRVKGAFAHNQLLTHISAVDRRFASLCKLKSTLEGFRAMGCEECLELFLSPHSHQAFYGNTTQQATVF